MALPCAGVASHAMDSYRQGIGGRVWRQVRGADEQFAHEGTRLFLLFQMRYQQGRHRRFRSVGYHLYGIGQHLVERE